MSSEDNLKHDNNIGLLTSIWGSNTWNSLHCVTFAYPENPTEEDKQHYKTYFEMLKYVLPCCTCRSHLTEHTKPGAKFEITISIFENRKTLTRWLYDLHNYVDKTLEMKYDITYDDLCEKYNSYIADCTISLDKKTIAYKNAYDREAPYVPYEIAVKFSDYAKIRGMNNFKQILDETNENFKNKRGNKKENWVERNTLYWEKVKNMRINSKLGFETKETNLEYKNLPSIDELELIQLMSTTLKESTLNHMLEKIEKKKKT